MTSVREKLFEQEKKKQVIRELENNIFKFINKKNIKSIIKIALKSNIEVYHISGSNYVELDIPINFNGSFFNPQKQYRFIIYHKDSDKLLVYLKLVPNFFTQKIQVKIDTYEQDSITEKEIIEFLTLLLGI